ncbi:predicted protein [Plenodomus lingam JN3]|uniref:Predicted protein n=1 Tax=Leptosphaeria maculans (strain JN3 / isolate v23.1.3 / race Av1-4-5-6-7-8) TaxID=985895 RepID=E4ZYB3_LEPMJ|nr:predicted protein [Plenodomus lingam JN3]CBX96358.1 predicted protein [Plenodomus lingam JN3]
MEDGKVRCEAEATKRSRRCKVCVGQLVFWLQRTDDSWSGEDFLLRQ